MTTLVTGGAGYIGSHAVLALLDAGLPVVVVDNLATGFRDAVPSEVPFIEADVADDAAVGQTIEDFGVNEVLHFAASVVVPDSIAYPLDYYLNNTAKTRSLIATVAAHGVERFVFSSTAAVYGDATSAKVKETDPLTPISPYGWSKAMSERILIDTCAVNPMKYAILRYFNVAGADRRGRAGQRTKDATHLIKVAAEAAVGRRNSITIFGTDYPTADGTCIRDYIHVSDLADIHIAALLKLRSGLGSQIMNCGYGRGTSVREVLDAVSAIAPIDRLVSQGPRRLGDPVQLVADVSKMKDMLGYKPKWDDLGVIVRSAVAFEQAMISARP